MMSKEFLSDSRLQKGGELSVWSSGQAADPLSEVRKSLKRKLHRQRCLFLQVGLSSVFVKIALTEMWKLTC